MKRLLSVFVLMSAGCVDLQFMHRDAAPSPVTPVSSIAAPIAADQVNSANARTMAQALWDEFDREDLHNSHECEGKQGCCDKNGRVTKR